MPRPHSQPRRQPRRHSRWPARLVWTCVLTAAMGAVIALGGAPAAQATPGKGLEVSEDGKNFQRAIGTELFSGLGRVVPGDSGTDRVWIRNGSAQVGKLRLELTDGWTDSAALAGATRLSINVDGRSVNTSLGDPLVKGTCAVVSPSLTIKPGQTLRFDASIAIDRTLGARDGRDGARKSMGFQVRAAALDAAAAQDKTPPCGAAIIPWDPSGGTPTAVASGQPGGSLVNTGADVAGWVLLGGGLSAVGLLLAARRRRREHA